MKKVLLYSGGSDSWLIDKIWKPDLKIYVDMKTRYSAEEIQRIKDNKDDAEIIEFPLGQYEREDAIIPLRNLYLFMAVINHLELTRPDWNDVEIMLGGTKSDRVLDKSIPFAEKATDLINYLYTPQHWCPEGKKFKLCLDFKSKTKRQIIEDYVNAGGDLKAAYDQSFSCYDPLPNGDYCGKCKPCHRKIVAFALNGYVASEEKLNIALDYIMEEIYPQMLARTYGRPDEELDNLEILRKYGRIENE